MARMLERGFGTCVAFPEERAQESSVGSLLIDDPNLPEGMVSRTSLVRLVEACLTSLVKDKIGIAESIIRNIFTCSASLGMGEHRIAQKYFSNQVTAAMRVAMQPPPSLLSDQPIELPQPLSYFYYEPLNLPEL